MRARTCGTAAICRGVVVTDSWRGAEVTVGTAAKAIGLGVAYCVLTCYLSGCIMAVARGLVLKLDLLQGSNLRLHSRFRFRHRRCWCNRWSYWACRRGLHSWLLACNTRLSWCYPSSLPGGMNDGHLLFLSEHLHPPARASNLK